jgi:MoxR-like ATPase
MAVLLCIEGSLMGAGLELQEEGALVLGRGAVADLEIDDPVMSSTHAEFRASNGQWSIRDLGSSNGTMVNGNAVTTHALVDGDRIQTGNTTFRYGAGEPDLAPPPIEPVKASSEDVERVLRMKEKVSLIRQEVSKTIVGQTEVIDQVLMCLIAGGHALLIGLPGMAKTLMVSTMAKVLDMNFKRVQFTPDLMPSDITGTEVLSTNKETGEKEFRFIHGPIFCNLLLADEINRTPPKTQAALLEAMQEKMVTTGNVSYKLPPPFFVLATQNPIEQEGTYPLPEAQLDRFMFNIWVDYPLKDEEHAIVSSTTAGALEEPNCVLTQADVIELQRVVRQIPVSDHVIRYAIELVRATRPNSDEAPEVTKKYVSTGAGPRAGQYLVLAGKARAALDGRIHVSCNDIRGAAVPVLRHRILTNFAADSEGKTSMDIVEQLVKEIPEPDENAYGG